jgi:ABC-type transport system involved in multi-copper enzyme maturation permease subunit
VSGEEAVRGEGAVRGEMVSGRQAAVAAPRPPSFLSGAWRIFELSLGELLWSRRTIFMAVVLAAPVVLALASRLVQAGGITPLRINGVSAGGAGVFGVMIWILYLRFVVPVLAVFYGTALIADEVEDKTITYLFTRPIARAAVLAGKYLAYVVCTSLVVLPSVVIVYFLLIPPEAIAGTFPALVTDLGLLALGLIAYGALFSMVGAVLKRPLVVGLVFAFGWEQGALLMPGYLRQFTVAYYLQSLVPHAMPTDSTASLLQAVLSDTPSVGVSLLALFLMTAAALAVAMAAVERREYVLEQ